MYTGEKKESVFLQTRNRLLEAGFSKNKYEHAEIFTSEEQLKLGEHFYFPISYGRRTIKEYKFKKEKRKEKEVQEILSKNFHVFCRDLEKKGVEIIRKNVKIYNESQSAKASGSLTLIKKAEKRRETEMIQIEEKKIPEGVN